MSLLSQVVVFASILILIIVLFFDEQDYLSFSVLLMLISGITTAIDYSEAQQLATYIEAIDWEVIFFLISMFTIVEILNEARFFHFIAKFIVNKFSYNIRIMFYLICLVSTISASIIEDLSVAMIFIPIIVIACSELRINPSPFLLGMTICINLASTLTPFGSPENVIIAYEYELALPYFVSRLGPYFFFTTLLTLFLLDRLILSKNLEKQWAPSCSSPTESPAGEREEFFEDIEIDKVRLIKNAIGFLVFIILLVFIHEVYLVGLLGMVMFVFLNMQKSSNGHQHPQLSKYLSRVDYKLIYFFMCLFILVKLMEINQTIAFLEQLFENLNLKSVFTLAIIILLVTSLLSGFIDNAPVTIMFIPIIRILTRDVGYDLTPLIIAFILGINLGGNFLPQGSAADMMTLELSRKHCVEDLTYRRLTKVGGLFAGLHVLMGTIYLALLVFLGLKVIHLILLFAVLFGIVVVLSVITISSVKKRMHPQEYPEQKDPMMKLMEDPGEEKSETEDDTKQSKEPR